MKCCGMRLPLFAMMTYLADVLVKLKLIEPLWEDYTTESDAMCWLEKEPPLKDKLRVLEEMGYDLSILKLEK